MLDALDDMLGPHIYAPREDGGDPRQCPTCGTGKLNLKAGKFGAFVGCTNYPECRYTRPLAADSEASADRILGKDPVSDLDVVVKAGRFGPYIQLGEQKDYAEGEKPKRAGIPKNMSPGDIELELALKLLSLPREIGRHPETGEPITAGLGRFGPFVRHEKTYASLEAGDEVFDIGLNRAVTLIAEKIAKGPSGRRFGADPGKPLGDHPTLGGVAVKNGRYGAYVTAGGVNATIPSDKTPETITLAGSHRADRRARGQGRRQAEARRQGHAKAEEGRGQSRGRSSRGGEAGQEGRREEIRGKTEIRCHQQGARAGDGNRQDLAGQGCQSPSPRRAPARQADKWHGNATATFPAGTPSSPSFARIRERSEPARSPASSASRTPTAVQLKATAARARRRRHDRQARQEGPRAGGAAADRDGRHHRPRQRR